MHPKALNELGKVILASESYVFYKGEVLIHRRSNTARNFPGFLIGPGGHVDEGEDVIVAAVREIKEETGITVPLEAMKLKAIAIHHHLDRKEIWVSLICRADLEAVPEEIQHSDEGVSEWMPVDELLRQENVFPPSKLYFNHVLRDQPGLMHTNVEWNGSQLVRVCSQTITNA